MRTRVIPILIAALIMGTGAAAWLLWRVHRGGGAVGNLTEFRIVPAHGRPSAVAISPDGATVAMLHREMGQTTTEVVEVRDVASGRDVKTLELPPQTWHDKPSWFVLRPVRYCDRGKFLVVFAWPDMLYVVDTATWGVREAIELSDLKAADGRRFGDLMLSRNVQLDCAAEAGALALSVSDDVSFTATKVIDLDTGKQTADLSSVYEGRDEGDGMAISAAGTRLAIVTWKPGEGSGVELVDVRERRRTGRLALHDKPMTEHMIAWTGGIALLVGEPECLPNRGCDHRQMPSGRARRLIDLGTGTARSLAWPGAEVYRSMGASADGSVAFGYEGEEKYCASCNRGAGELKIADARFVVWDAATGQVMARSPRLRVEDHSCPLIHAGASCTEYKQAPEMEMSADGRTVEVFWPPGDAAAAENSTGEVEIFRR